MNQLTEQQNFLPSTPQSEAEAILEASRADAGFDKLLKFKKGDYICGDDEVPLGTECVAHCVGWTKAWIKFVDSMPAERKIYRVLRNEIPPERPDLPDLDQTKWEVDPNGRPMDPWSFQYLIPVEFIGTDEMAVFVTASFGGRRAVADLCAAWSRKAIKDPGCGMPIVRLKKAMMPSKKWGDIPRPYFEIVGWEQTTREPRREVNADSIRQDVRKEMNDDIPF